jgi:hypothetical protein
MPTPRLRLGQLLVDAGMISQKDLDEVLALQKVDGRRLGMLLVERAFINETQLTQILSHQLSVPWVSLLHIEFSRQLLNLVPHSVAERYCMVPIYVRHVRGQGQTLYVAMDDPTNEEGLRECTAHSGLPVKAMIAPPSDIRNAIRVYYGVTPTASNTPAEGADANADAAAQLARETRDTTPEATEPGALPAAQPPDAPAIEVGDTTITSGEFAQSDPREALTMSAPIVEHTPLSPIAAPLEATAPAETTASAPTETTASTPAEPPPAPPPRKQAPSAPDIPPATLPDPGAQSPEFAKAAAAARTSQVSIVEARPLPPLSERIKPLLEVVEDAQPPTLDQGAAPPSSQPVDTIPEPRGRAPRMIALTLLDGTTINLPAPRKQRQRPSTIAQQAGATASEDEVPSTVAGDDAGMTARDLVAALRAVCHGADPKEILGPNLRIEAVVAALLSLLLRKGTIADWEFVDELRKI